MKKEAKRCWNGMINVPDIAIEYKGFTIRPKLDMGTVPWQVNGNEYRRGYIVVRDNAQVMPGGAWFHSIIEARVAIDLFIEADGNGTVFWDLWYEQSGLSEYADV